MALIAVGALLIVGILTAVSLGVGWMATTASGQDLTYTLSDADFGPASVSYGEMAAGDDDVDGVGMITTARVLGIVGLVFAFLAMAVLAVSLVVRKARLTLVGSILATVTALLLILTVVLAPLGISAFHDDTFGAGGASLKWGTGLILGIIMAVFAIGASVLGFVGLRDPEMS